jgi:UDP:flavonoid glycosyltransferase YjiC (YdhE family)
LAHVVDADALRPSVARAAVLEGLGNPSYRKHAEKLRAEIEALPGPEQAVDYLERLVAGADPVLAHR